MTGPDERANRGLAIASWAERVERWITRFVMATLAVVILSQVAMLNPAARDRLSFLPRLEGYSLEGPVPEIAATNNPPAQAQWIKLVLVNKPSAPGVFILVNGKSSADLARGEVRVEVRGGDLLEIDGRGSFDTLTVRVVSLSQGLSFPGPGTEFVVQGDIVALGRIR